MRNGGKRGTKLAKLHVLCLRSTLGKDEKCVQNFGLETRQQRFILAPRRRGEHIYIQGIMMWITFSWPRTSSSLAVKPRAKFVNYVYIYYENCTITYAIRYSVYYDFTRRPANQPTVTALALCLRMLDTPDRCNNSGITCVRSLTAPSVSKPQNRRMRG